MATRCRLKVALYNELEYIRDGLTAWRGHYIHRIHAHAVGFIETDELIPLSNRIYRDKYAEISLNLSRNQRMSYENIHSIVDMVNSRINRIADLTIKTIETKDQQLFDQLGQLLRSQFANIDLLRWAINYHLRNPKKPAWEMNKEAAADYLKVRRNICEEIERLFAEFQQKTLDDYLAQKESRFQFSTMSHQPKQ
jgi:hypothetical protein